jgi:hypothetical protein
VMKTSVALANTGRHKSNVVKLKMIVFLFIHL